MRYWLLEKGDVIGPFEKEELKDREGFSQSSMVCPESHGEDHTQWREAYYFTDFLFAAEQPEAAEQELPAAPPPAPRFDTSEQTTTAFSKKPSPENYENISIEEYFNTVYQSENDGLSEILGIPDDLENSDLYLGRFLQEQLSGEKRTRNTKIKDLETGKTIDKKENKSFGNEGKILVSRTIKNEGIPEKPAGNTEKKEQKPDFSVELRPLYDALSMSQNREDFKEPAPPPSAPAAPAEQKKAEAPATAAKPEITMPPLAEALKKDAQKEEVKEAPAAPQSAKKEQISEEQQQPAAVVPVQQKEAVKPMQEKPVASRLEEIKKKISQPLTQVEEKPQQKVEPKEEPKKEAAKEPETQRAVMRDAKAVPAVVPDTEIKQEEIFSESTEQRNIFNKVVQEEEAVLEPIKTITPARRLEDFLKEDTGNFDFEVGRKNVEITEEFKQEQKKKEQKKKIVTVFASSVICLGVVGVIFFNAPKRNNPPPQQPAAAAPAQNSAPLAAKAAAAPAAITEEELVSKAVAQDANETALQEKAIDIVKKYPVKSKNDTVGAYLPKVLDSYIQKGYTASWSAEHLHKDIYIVKYRLIKTRQEPIVYMFEVDTKKNIISGALNNLTLDLLGM
ncbi:hypothetical protein Dip510_000353 [Elusimicrobium posterum]|uniref:hypothetical protein n=1 Tax=Elusimicrobium posterum TaxID=3116653 RepID=UPI003C750EA8